MYKNVPVSPEQHKDIQDLKRILGFKSAGEVVTLAIENFYRVELTSLRTAQQAANTKRMERAS